MRNNNDKIVVVLGIYLFLNMACAFGPPNFPGGRSFSSDPSQMMRPQDIMTSDHINKDKPVDPYFRENFPYWLDGMDKEGRPVYTNPIGKWDVEGKVASQGRSEELRDYIVSIFEDCNRAIKKSSEMHPGNKPPVTQIIAIYDWEGGDWDQIHSFQTVQDFLQIARIYEKHYSEMVYALYFINCPDMISKVIPLLSPILTPNSKKKLKVYNTNKEVWQKEILQYIDPDQIRPEFGGTKDNDKNPFADSSTKT